MKPKVISLLVGIAVIGIALALFFDVGEFLHADHARGGETTSTARSADGDDHRDRHGDERGDRHDDKHGDERGERHSDEKTSEIQGKNDKHEREEVSTIRLSDTQVTLAGIKTVEISQTEISQTVQLTGEVRVNQDRVVQVVPRVPGVVRSVGAFLGDNVDAGTVMAVLDSRELADAKSAYFGARERTRLAQTKFKREENLWRKKISSEQEFLDAQSALTEAQIVERGAAQKLRALGISPDSLKDTPDASLTRFEVTAPFAGTVTEKNVTAGASVDGHEPIYRIADLRTVWVIASVYEKNIAQIAKGQTATVRTGAYSERQFQGRVTWISDTLDERTRTLKIRIEVDNGHRLLKPGMFVKADAIVGTRSGVITVPDAAIRRQGGETIVFVDDGGGRFTRREITLGIRSNGAAEVLTGLKPGERVVSAGSFLLKSELEKEGFGGGHGH